MMAESLWREIAGEPRPLATRCTECTRTAFPPASRCRFCGSRNVNQVELAAHAIVEAVSLMGTVLVVHARTTDGVVLLGQAEPAGLVRVGHAVRFRPTGHHMRFELDE